GVLPAEATEAIARTVGAALERCWSVEARIHGDLNFDNLLCDVEGRCLSFVDPGVLDSASLCSEVGRRWYPASRDLAHLLYETGVTVKRMFGNAGARRHQY